MRDCAIGLCPPSHASDGIPSYLIVSNATNFELSYGLAPKEGAKTMSRDENKTPLLSGFPLTEFTSKIRPVGSFEVPLFADFVFHTPEILMIWPMGTSRVPVRTTAPFLISANLILSWVVQFDWSIEMWSLRWPRAWFLFAFFACCTPYFIWIFGVSNRSVANSLFAAKPRIMAHRQVWTA